MEVRDYFVNAAISMVPDLVVAWGAAHLTDSGWFGFFVALAILQAIYFFLWFKNAVWAWLVFWTYGKRNMASYLEKFFIDKRFPAPDEYTTDLDDYLGEIMRNEELDPTVRVDAAFELGTMHGFKSSRKISLVLQLQLSGKIALQRYGSLARRIKGTQNVS